MRPLKSSERRLILVFGAIIFLIANFFGLEQLSEKRNSLEAGLRKLKLEKTESEFWLSQRDLWSKRKAWLIEKQPQMKGTGQESAELLESIQQSARLQKITLGERTIAEPSTSLHYSEIAVRLQATGSLEAISKWLAALQQPESFQAITSLTLKKNEDSATIACQLTIARWYALP